MLRGANRFRQEAKLLTAAVGYVSQRVAFCCDSQRHRLREPNAGSSFRPECFSKGAYPMLDRQWTFPLPRTHTGVPLGNGRLGALVWGEGDTLRMTLGRADLWDHRGGSLWGEGQTFTAIRESLERSDETRLRALFEQTDPEPGAPARPTIMPLGRVDITLPAQWHLSTAQVDATAGSVTVAVGTPDGTRTLLVTLHPEEDIMTVAYPGNEAPKVVGVPSWDLMSSEMQERSFTPPQTFNNGWAQAYPVDPAVCVAWRDDGGAVVVACRRGDDTATARADTEKLLAPRDGTSASAVAASAADWWQRYWDGVPVISVPNETLQFLYEYGMYKFGACSNPGGVAVGLQGPWIEEYAFPPWSADYHTNINVQMCYWPAYRGNRLEHVRPLWDMVERWRDRLTQNARVFAGIDDGRMLPHAVDDRCTAMGGFWAGAIDHGCTAWVARMMFRWYEYTMDTAFLRDTALPFMQGTMRVYEAMVERQDDGVYRLPVSVSPEYGGNRIDAWGANASFQLAAMHRLLEDLRRACATLGEEFPRAWDDIARGLPKASMCEWRGAETAMFEWHPEPYRVLGLWEGQPLEESHRHHSHMAGLFPFDTIDPLDPAWTQIVEDTYKQWVFRGPGLWSGWCIPWASILHARIGNADMAEKLLEDYARLFTNEGGNSVHDAQVPGYTLLGGTPSVSRAKRGPERMQIDACMAAATAVQEMLLSTHRGVDRVFDGVPSGWQDVSFEGMRTAGAFLVSASRVDGRTVEVRVRSLAGGTYRLRNPFDGAVSVTQKDGVGTVDGAVLALPIAPGEDCVLRNERSS